MATIQGSGGSEDTQRQKDLETYRKRLIEHRELDAKLKKSECICHLDSIVFGWMGCLERSTRTA